MSAVASRVTATPRSHLLDRLRSLMPTRRTPLTLDEALQIAERQAGLLRRELGLGTTHELDAEVVGSLPFVRVARERLLPTPGLLVGTDLGWVIALNAEDAHVRQKFSLLHEFKHLLDDPYITEKATHDLAAERVCNHFAACALIPRMLLKRDWGNGIQDPIRLATRYGVSVSAMAVRLRETGLIITPRRGERIDLSSDEIHQLRRRLKRAWHPLPNTAQPQGARA